MESISVSFSNSFSHNGKTFSVHMNGKNNKFKASIRLDNVEIVQLHILNQSDKMIVEITAHNLKIGLKNYSEKLKTLKEFLKKGFCDIFNKFISAQTFISNHDKYVEFILTDTKNKPIVEYVLKNIGIKNNQIQLKQLIEYCK